MSDDKQQGTDRGEKILREKVSDYKKAHPEALPELDYALMLKSLKRMNDASPVKIARNAFNEMREWIPGTQKWNVSKVYLSEDRCVVFTLSHTDKAMTVAMLQDDLQDIDKKIPMKNIPVLIEINEKTRVRATDLYAHSLVTSFWAGLPVDFVLCYSQKPEKKQAHVAEPEADEQANSK